MRTRLASLAALLAVLSLSAPARALYLQTNLVSDLPAIAAFQDASLQNPWGLARSATSPFWVADNGAGVSTIYAGDGTPNALVVSVPPRSGGTPPSTPTGVVSNPTTGFQVSAGTAAAFLFATEDGTISGWAGASGTTAIREVDSSASGAVYKGLAIGQVASASYLYAANFHAGTIDVFDSAFSQTVLSGQFTDPNLPAGYAPFDIQNLGGSLYVSYALQDATGHDPVPGAGHGIVDVFDSSGVLQRRLATGGALDSPWGMALAPADFGEFSNALLVGNFGDGRIHAYDPATGTLLGALEDSPGHAIQIDGLWALAFGGGSATNGATHTLFFTAGIAGPDALEDHGLFGTLDAVPEPGGLSLLAGGLVPLWWAWRGHRTGRAPFPRGRLDGAPDPG